jgi:hypothetical protein
VNTGETDADTAGVGNGPTFLAIPMQHRARVIGLALLAVPSNAVFACDHGRPRGIPDGPPPEEGRVSDGGIDDRPIEHPGEGGHSDGSGEAE